MLTLLKNIYLQGITGIEVNVEVDVSPGMPKFEIVGLPDTALKESKERILTAIKNSGFEIVGKKIIVNLAPAEIRKNGTGFDLSIAIGILNNLKFLKSNRIKDYVFIGELSLNGKVNPISGVLPMCIELKKLGHKNIILPKENVEEGKLVNNINIIGVSNLIEVVDFINEKKELHFEKIESKIEWEEKNKSSLIDFNEVKGQSKAKRALEISAAGGHNIILIGEPGSRKNNVSTKNKNNNA